MKRKIKNILLIILTFIMLISNISFATEVNITNTTNEKFHNPPSISVPETHINLKVNNMTRGTKVYLLLSENLIKHNMQKFIDNNINNPYAIEAQEATKFKKFLDKADYLGYIEHMREAGFEVENNEIELRHYCFCLGDFEVLGYINHNNIQYIQIAIELNENNEFKVIMKDYLTKYEVRDTKFLIDEYGSKTFIDLENISLTPNAEKPSITECNVTHEFLNKEEYEDIERAIDITYLIIYIILIIIALIVLIILIKRHIKKKEELEARKFWKKKLTKEEKKEQRKKIKEEKKAAKKNKKKK